MLVLSIFPITDNQAADGRGELLGPPLRLDVLRLLDLLSLYQIGWKEEIHRQISFDLPFSFTRSGGSQQHGQIGLCHDRLKATGLVKEELKKIGKREGHWLTLPLPTSCEDETGNCFGLVNDREKAIGCQDGLVTHQRLNRYAWGCQPWSFIKKRKEGERGWLDFLADGLPPLTISNRWQLAREALGHRAKVPATGLGVEIRQGGVPPPLPNHERRKMEWVQWVWVIQVSVSTRLKSYPLNYLSPINKLAEPNHIELVSIWLRKIL